MRREKRYIQMDSAEHRLAIVGMNHFRNHLIQTGKPTEDVDALLIKLWKAKVKHRDRIRNSQQHAMRTKLRKAKTKTEWRKGKCWN